MHHFYRKILTNAKLMDYIHIKEGLSKDKMRASTEKKTMKTQKICGTKKVSSRLVNAKKDRVVVR